MSAALRLPPTLLDFTFARASARLHLLNSRHPEGLQNGFFAHSRRYAHQSVLLAHRSAPPAHHVPGGSESDQSFYNRSVYNSTAVISVRLMLHQSETEDEAGCTGGHRSRGGRTRGQAGI